MILQRKPYCILSSCSISFATVQCPTRSIPTSPFDTCIFLFVPSLQSSRALARTKGTTINPHKGLYKKKGNLVSRSNRKSKREKETQQRNQKDYLTMIMNTLQEMFGCGSSIHTVMDDAEEWMSSSIPTSASSSNSATSSSQEHRRPQRRQASSSSSSTSNDNEKEELSDSYRYIFRLSPPHYVNTTRSQYNQNAAPPSSPLRTIRRTKSFDY